MRKRNKITQREKVRNTICKFHEYLYRKSQIIDNISDTNNYVEIAAYKINMKNPPDFLHAICYGVDGHSWYIMCY